MQRNRLKNIINKAKTISNKQEVGNPFNEFKRSLPKEVDSNYRLEAAWKAYGKPRNYNEAVWVGMIQPIDENNYKFPSIGYNEETDEYEYLNKGKENETVDKDIRVWDNDVIPFVKELKQGGFIRLYDEEKDCWVYRKGGKIKILLADGSGYIEVDSLDADQKAGRKPIGRKKDGTRLYLNGDGKAMPADKSHPELTRWFKQGGKEDEPDEMPIKAPQSQPSDLVKLIYNSNANFAKRLLDPNRKILDLGNGEIGNFKLSYATNDKGVVVYPEIQEINGELVDLSNDRNAAYESAMRSGDYVIFPSEESADWFTADNYKRYFPGLEKYAPLSRKFKQGGQMNVIPEGALHARKNNMEGAGKDFTSKGIPVVSKEKNGDIIQHAEIEKEELTVTKEVTDKLESWYKDFYDEDTSNKEKDEIAIKCGKYFAKEILFNTDDRVGLIDKLKSEI